MFVPIQYIHYEDATKSELLNNTENFALFTTDDDGYYSLDLAIKGTTGKYTIKLTGDGISEKKEFNYATLSDKKAIVNSLYQNGDYSSLCQPSSSDAGKLGLDTSCFDKINLTNLGNIIATLANSTEKDSEKLNEFLTIYNKALSIEKLNSGLVNDITTLDALSLNNKAVELYNKMNESVKKDISNVKMTGADLLSEEAVNDKFIKEVSLAVINNVANTQNILDVIDNFHSEIGFTNAQYQRYSNLGETLQANLGAEVVKKGGNTSLSAFVTNVMALVDNTVIIIPAPSIPQGGGGGGGGISGATVTGNTESYTPSLNEITYDVFTDLQGFDWAKDAVNSLYNKGIVSGTGTGNFEPQREVKREEFIKMIDTLYEGSYETLEFSDVDSSSWYAPFVIKAVNAGIIKGIDNNTFGTGRGVTREDMAVILVRLLNIESVTSYNSFKDDSDIASYAKDAVYTLKDMGIVSGTGEGNFEPKRIMTRAEAAVVISNFITKLNLN